jgi:uncharacterized membrane protein
MATTTGSTGSVTLAGDRGRRDTLRIVSIILALIGLGISGYIAVSELTNTATICPQTGVFNCDLVQHSVYSRVGPIPVVFLGLAGYALIFLLLLLNDRVPYSRMLIFVLTLGGFMFSGYLTSMEAFVLHSWCLWCVGSAITMTLLFIVSSARLWQSFSAEAAEEEE